MSKLVHVYLIRGHISGNGTYSTYCMLSEKPEKVFITHKRYHGKTSHTVYVKQKPGTIPSYYIIEQLDPVVFGKCVGTAFVLAGARRRVDEPLNDCYIL